MSCWLEALGHQADALHLALAIHHKMDYLLTWNHAHLANADVQRKVAALCTELKWRLPYIVSPNTIPWETLGHEIQRRDR